MVRTVRHGDNEIEYTLTLKDIRHIHLKIDKNGVSVSANRKIALVDIDNTVINKAKWIEKHLKNVNKNIDISSSDTIPILGKEIPKVLNIDKFYLNRAKELIPEIANQYSDITNLKYSKIQYRKCKSRWGSCKKDELNFNTYLLMLPIECIEYVVLHEIAHIKHKNHSKQFYNFIYQYMPDYKSRESAIKEFKYSIR